MLLMLLKKTQKSLRGELSRWMIQPENGVFIGNPSERVRDELWKKAVNDVGAGYVIQIWSTLDPQGFNYRQYNNEGSKKLVDFEGLALVISPATNSTE